MYIALALNNCSRLYKLHYVFGRNKRCAAHVHSVASYLPLVRRKLLRCQVLKAARAAIAKATSPCVSAAVTANKPQVNTVNTLAAHKALKVHNVAIMQFAVGDNTGSHKRSCTVRRGAVKQRINVNNALPCFLGRFASSKCNLWP